jgi:pilus assembly protein CpaE
MDKSKPIVGIVSSSREIRDLFLAQLQEAKFECFTIEVDGYLEDQDNYETRQLVEVHPQIVIVDMQSRETALTTLQVLHDVLPEAWLFISAPGNDPQLIIEAMHAGAREFLPKPSSLDDLSQALERYSAVQQKTINLIKGKVFGVTSAKGGAGTTSVAINLAIATANDASAKVALVDFGSPVGDVAEYLNLKSKYTVADAVKSKTRLDPVLLESYMSGVNGVSVLPGNREFHSGLFQQNTLTKMFQVLSETFTHTFIDMACAHDHEQLQAATKFCNAILIILTPELPALWRTDRLISLFNKTGGNNKIRLVVNRASKKRDISVREIEKALGHSIFWNLPNNYPEAIEAVNSGKPLTLSNNSKLAASYIGLVKTLTGLSPIKKRRGLLGI